MSAALDLFDTPAVAGLDYRDDFLDEGEERSLIARIGATDLSPFKFQQWTGKRLTHSSGWTYDFKSGRFAPAEPIPNWLAPVKLRAAAFAGLAPDELVQALLIRYDPGAGIGWHKDRSVFEHVIGISLGNQVPMRFRRHVGKGFERVSAPLMPRSIYHLSGEARHEWEHSIAPMSYERWSITFRSLSRKRASSPPIQS